MTKTPRSSISSDTDDVVRGALISPFSPDQPEKNSFFLTNRKLSRSLADFEESDLTGGHGGGSLRRMNVPARSVPFLPVSEAEADDELDNDHGLCRRKPATRRAHIRANFEESLHRRKPGENQSPRHLPATGTHSMHACMYMYMYVAIHYYRPVRAIANLCDCRLWINAWHICTIESGTP